MRDNYPKPLDEQAIMQLIFGQVVAKPVLLVVARHLVQAMQTRCFMLLFIKVS